MEHRSGVLPRAAAPHRLHRALAQSHGSVQLSGMNTDKHAQEWSLQLELGQPEDPGALRGLLAKKLRCPE